MNFPDDVPVLASGDVTLRAHRLDDVPAIVEQCTDPLSVRWTTVPLDYTAELATDWVTVRVPATWQGESERLFAIECTHPDGTRRFAGSLSLRDEGDQRAEIAFGAHPAVRGRGVMTTAVGLLLDYGFNECGIETVVWYAEVGNLASRRVAWKAGFTFAGTLRRWLPHRGAYVDGWAATLHKDDPRVPTSRWLAVPVISGPTIGLRPMADADALRVVEACSDPRTLEWLSRMPEPYGVHDALEYIDRQRVGSASGHVVQWAVVDSTTDELLGAVSIPRMQGDEGEIGYWMHPAARGRGVMTEAVGLVVRHAFLDPEDGGLGMRRLLIKAATRNHASQHVARSNGFTQYGVERQAEPMRDGTYADLAVFDLLRPEWTAQQSRR
jgi:RimJ/RimL family protein N-acetyltransferase